MTLLETPRSRFLIGTSAILLAAISFCLLFSRYDSHILAAKRAMQAEDSRAAASLTAQPAQHSGANPVIVELFTSEGCSSCPPADALLARLQQEQPVPSANIIALEEHVDYWDHLGWRDPFSSPYITQRQRSYQSVFNLGDVYTPQFVINGSAQFDGTDPSAIESAIAQASANTIPLQFTSVQFRLSSPVDVSFTVANAPATHTEYVRRYAALVDPEDTTDVHAGENNGRTLHHVDTVRTFAMNGESWHMKVLGKSPWDIQLPARSNPVGMRLVVFAQTKPFGPILGAASCTITRQNLDKAPATSGPAPPNACPAPPITLAQ